MRKLLLIISILLSFNVVSAQQQKDTLSYSSLSKEQRLKWSDLEDKWTLDYFNNFLQKNKLKTSCARCNSIIFEALFIVIENGGVKVELISNKVCGKNFTKKQEAELKQLLQKIIFPAEFYNGNYLFKMGRTLKC
ncbi:MAG: hypothetical protein IPG89_21325 [Bacteroidetes bacterium]|nr:hypothetical protein [Bacteroidota bacterium]